LGVITRFGRLFSSFFNNKKGNPPVFSQIEIGLSSLPKLQRTQRSPPFFLPTTFLFLQDFLTGSSPPFFSSGVPSMASSRFPFSSFFPVFSPFSLVESGTGKEDGLLLFSSSSHLFIRKFVRRFPLLFFSFLFRPFVFPMEAN